MELKKQEVVAQSAAEAEYIAAAVTVNQALWLRKLCLDLKTKHINVKFHAIREAEKLNEVKFNYCNSNKQVAAIFTKALPKESDEESSEDEELLVAAAENGKAKTDVKTSKANAGKPDAVKQAVKIEEPRNNKKTEEDDDESDSQDESGSDEEDDSEDEDESDEMSMDESSDDKDEETPNKVEASKKRPAEAATPVSAKKAKSAATSDGKKGGHRATPHPSKQAGKSSAKSPKSGGQFTCGSCNKSFGSEGGLESHKKAKHGGK
ncbi:hypothetical protein QQP08_000443 [Theobroma cacao]|nr:hypothetical protein QQP08_000443 [Theobroma cacao]